MAPKESAEEDRFDESFNLASFEKDRKNFLVGLDATETGSDDGSDASAPILKDRSFRTVMRTVWKITLGVAALLDCVSTVFPRQMVLGSCGSPSDQGTCSVDKLSVFGKEYPLYNHNLLGLLAWLDQHAVYFGFAFSLLWCVQAFRDARDTRLKALRERDRKRLMVRGDSIRCLGNEDDLVKSGYFGGFRPWLAFYTTLIVQLLLVPVGFYALLYQGFQIVSASPDLREIVEHVDGNSEETQTLQSILNSTYQVIVTETSKEDFTKDAGLSVILLVAKHAGISFKNSLGARLKKWAVRTGFKEGRKRVFRAIVRPDKVWKQARKAIKWVRWLKYLAPIIATSNKLRDNVCDLLKKHRQERDAILAMKIRAILWKKMTPEQRRDKSARCIQSTYRSYRVRRARWALALIQCHRDDLAAIRVQTMLRKMLQRARLRIRQKRAELKELEARESSVVRRGRRMTMSPCERKRLYELQDEMESKKSKSIDHRLLMRPNTRFSVVWKSLFVFCVLVEITGLAVNPILAKHKVKGTRKPVTVSTKLQGVLIPEPVASHKACTCVEREREGFNSWILAKTRPTNCPPEPWFCGPPYSTAQSIYSTVMMFILNNFMVIVGIICFLDVPMYHYTGELCGETGSIIPKSFVKRWLVPGLLVQLLVNPQMESTSKLIFRMLAGALEVGPIRVLRWIEAFFYPSLVLAIDLFENKFMVPAVAHVNRHKVDISPDEEEVLSPPAVVRRRASVMRRTSIAVQRRSSLVDFHPRRSSLSFQSRARRATLMPIKRRSSIVSSATSRRSSLALPGMASSATSRRSSLTLPSMASSATSRRSSLALPSMSSLIEGKEKMW